MIVDIKPSTLKGEIEAPPSKSYAHRMMIAAALSGFPCRVAGISESEDMMATLDCLKAMGLGANLMDGALFLDGMYFDCNGVTFPCRESGSTLRFFIPIALALSKGKVVFTGTERLIERGIGVYEEVFSQKGITVKRDKESIEFVGSLSAGEYIIPGNVSSQFVTGLLMALPLLDEESTIKVVGKVESRAYIDITLDVLSYFGVEIIEKETNTFVIPKESGYSARDAVVEGDWSNGAALLAYNHVGADIKVSGLNHDSIQGDKVCIDYFKNIDDKTEIMDISNCPDLGPILFALAAAKGGGEFTGTKRLSIKESPRDIAMQEELKKFGIEMDVEENRVYIHPGNPVAPKEILSGHNDHRIVMALSLLCSITGGKIDDAESVRKSFPDYFEKLEAVGMEVKFA